MVNIPVTGAVKVEYAIMGGGTYAVFVETTTPTKWEIGLKTVDGVTDVLQRVCVTYTEGAAFASVPANATTATQHQATHYLRKLENGGTENWWPVDAAFAFAGDTKTVCVVTDGQAQGAEVDGPFPKSQPTTTTTSVTPTTTTTVPACGGKSVGGYCWYLGAQNESCDTVCATRGGNTMGTIQYTGSAGTDDNCIVVLNAVGAKTATFSPNGNPLEMKARMGCGLFSMSMSGSIWRGRYYGATTTFADYEYETNRVCSCAM